MAIADYKITDTTGVKVEDIPGSTLSGEDVQANKRLFDLYSDLIVQKYNDLVDYLQDQGIDSLATWRQNVLKQVYPIGSVYVSVGTTSPATLFGGTWTKIQDKFLLSSGTKTLGATGGEESHTLTTSEIPSHTHSVSGTASSAGSHRHAMGEHFSSGSGGSKTGYVKSSDRKITSLNTESAGAHTHSVTGTAQSTGGGNAHNNMPPYLVVNVWKRTA